MAFKNRYKEELKQYKNNKRKNFIKSLPHKLGFHFHWYKDLQMKNIIEQNLLPDTSSVNKHLAFIIDDEVVEIMHCQERLAAILLSNPKIVEVLDLTMVKVGYKYKNNKFIK
jgi:hypothetical protein